MVPVEMLSPGMRVKIVDSWNDRCGQNYDGLMDKYLGQIVTVLEVRGRTVLIEEDAGECEHQADGHWIWNSWCFDYIAYERQEDFEVSSKDEILSFILGTKSKGGETDEV